MKSLLLAVLLAGSTFAQDAKRGPLAPLISSVDRHYNALRTLQCNFTEHYSGNGIERNESGTLLLKKPGRMRWNYEQPRVKLFVSDGKTAWFYVPGDRQARKSPAKELDDLRSPLRYLLGKTRLEKELEGLTFASDVPPMAPNDVLLRGRPKAMADQVQDVVLEINPAGQIVRLAIHSTDGSTTEFGFSNIRENAPLADSEFMFSPPPGVEVITSKDITAPQ
ncbi:MAG TPA: outer membrane lipoprotein carrier protein LolA [Terriglobales bacterium]|nr:outer membrane lipoprotein carrier protein LolA [Terriglobales bacterium]